MNAAALGPIWIHPPRFWKAVDGKSEDEIVKLLDYLTQLLAEGQIETLLQFDFVTGVGYPYPNTSRQRRIQRSQSLSSNDCIRYRKH